MKALAVCAALLAIAAAPAHPQPAVHTSFHDTHGKRLGTARIAQTPAGVLISLDLQGLPPGEHGFHIHETGRCDAQDGFESAGGHFAPEEKPHGYLGEKGHHAGDMPNQFVSADGRLRAQVLNPRVHLTEKSLFDRDGSALVIHAGPDDYKSQPAGAAGERIACAVIRRG